MLQYDSLVYKGSLFAVKSVLCRFLCVASHIRWCASKPQEPIYGWHWCRQELLLKRGLHAIIKLFSYPFHLPHSSWFALLGQSISHPTVVWLQDGLLVSFLTWCFIELWRLGKCAWHTPLESQRMHIPVETNRSVLTPPYFLKDTRKHHTDTSKAAITVPLGSITSYIKTIFICYHYQTTEVVCLSTSMCQCPTSLKKTSMP